VTLIKGAGHSPHRDAPEQTLEAISEFTTALLQADEGARGRAA